MQLKFTMLDNVIFPSPTICFPNNVVFHSPLTFFFFSVKDSPFLLIWPFFLLNVLEFCRLNIWLVYDRTHIFVFCDKRSNIVKWHESLLNVKFARMTFIFHVIATNKININVEWYYMCWWYVTLLQHTLVPLTSWATNNYIYCFISPSRK